jgi:hypothetical protein
MENIPRNWQQHRVHNTKKHTTQYVVNTTIHKQTCLLTFTLDNVIVLYVFTVMNQKLLCTSLQFIITQLYRFVFVQAKSDTVLWYLEKLPAIYHKILFFGLKLYRSKKDLGTNNSDSFASVRSTINQIKSHHIAWLSIVYVVVILICL